MFDKLVAAVTPPESDEARREAREQARAQAGPADWLGLALDHHEQIERGFEEVRSANNVADRRAAQKALALILNGHSLAEEIVLYPALVQANEKAHAGMAYTEQSGTKVQMGELETLAPMSREYADKLEHIAGAVRHHMYQEEKTWFLELREKLPPAELARLTDRFREEFERYVGDDAPLGALQSSGAAREAQHGASYSA